MKERERLRVRRGRARGGRCGRLGRERERAGEENVIERRTDLRTGERAQVGRRSEVKQSEGQLTKHPQAHTLLCLTAPPPA